MKIKISVPEVVNLIKALQSNPTRIFEMIGMNVQKDPEYFIVPKRKVDRLVGYARNKKSAWINFKDVYEFKDKWHLMWKKKVK